MPFTTLLSIDDLQKNLADKRLVILDCRYDIKAPDAGRQAYAAGHLPGALYADLKHDLSGPVIAGQTGRHPLPDPEEFAAKCAMWGIDSKSQVVCYDSAAGAMAAARCWWMLKWLGHEHVAVLAEGFDGWQKAGATVTTETFEPTATEFEPVVNYKLLMETDDIAANLHSPEFPLFDSRSADRYRGENETIDVKAGHIPGAVSAPFSENLTEKNAWLKKAALKKRFTALLSGSSASAATFYCGSGVTACHNILACAHTGLGMPRLYAGGFSEWITDQARLIAT